MISWYGRVSLAYRTNDVSRWPNGSLLFLFAARPQRADAVDDWKGRVEVDFWI